MRTHMSEALAHLNQLIDLGAEFPDAVYDTSRSFDLELQDVECLEMLYDEQYQLAG